MLGCAVRRPLLALVLGVVACEAPPIRLAPSDAGVDAPKVCAKVIGPDGATCTGPDEDGDCIPDACDDCPNVPQRLPSGRAAGIGAVGASCVPPSSPFDVLTRRVRFDPFATSGPWSSYHATEGARWSSVDGVASLGQPLTAAAYALLSAGSELDDVSVLARVRMVDGESAGLAVRAKGSFGSFDGYLCVVRDGSLLLARAQSCSVSSCNVILALTDGSGVTAGRAMPFTNTNEWFYLRVSIVDRTIECQAYSSPDAPDAIALRNLPPNENTVRAVVEDGPAALTKGGVGFLTTRTRLEVSSVDVLSR